MWLKGLICCWLILMTGGIQAQGDDVTIRRIAAGLQNPRGVAVLPDGRLLVAEAGTGYVPDDPAGYTGKLSVFDDLNGDGDYDDAGERTPILEQLPGYNILYQFNPGRDEIVGIGDVLVLDDGRVYFTLDDNFEVISIVELTPEFERVGHLFRGAGTLNAIVYDETTERLYVAESTTNTLRAVALDGTSEFITEFDLLAHKQQAVPAGVAVDPLTGDVLVTLFSGNLWDYYGEILSFMPGDAQVVRVNPETGSVTPEIDNLTTAVDVAVDGAGNIFVAEMTTEWATPTLSHQFDLYSDDAPPDAGGYARFTGRVTMYPADESTPRILADRLDTPTNITLHDGKLYVSTGQGTPDRPIWVHGERKTITGEIYVIAVPAAGD